MLAIDRGCGVFLVLLDLSAAFDTVDHTILMDFLKRYIGIDGIAFNLLQSYLLERTQCVSIEGVLSEVSELLFGVPQGSVLGPIEFCIYTIPLGAIMRHYNIQYHIYADDTQLYCYFDLKSPFEALNDIRKCITDIRSWMIANKLKINDDKTEFIIIKSPRSNFSENIHLSIGQEKISPSSNCKSLGVMFDEHLMMDTFINHTCRSAHYHLRNISAVRDLITSDGAATLVHSLVSSKLDYCNSLLYNVPKYKTNNLQRILNIAARIVTKSNPDHITPILKSLHWLPIDCRIRYKVLLFTYKSLNDLAPSYLSSLIIPNCPKRLLRSASQKKLKVPETRLKSYGDRSFSVAAPTEWNKLPLSLKSAPTLSAFKSQLKTFLFKEHYK